MFKHMYREHDIGSDSGGDSDDDDDDDDDDDGIVIIDSPSPPKSKPGPAVSVHFVKKIVALKMRPNSKIYLGETNINVNVYSH